MSQIFTEWQTISIIHDMHWHVICSIKFPLTCPFLTLLLKQYSFSGQHHKLIFYTTCYDPVKKYPKWHKFPGNRTHNLGIYLHLCIWKELLSKLTWIAFKVYISISLLHFPGNRTHNLGFYLHFCIWWMLFIQSDLNCYQCLYRFLSVFYIPWESYRVRNEPITIVFIYIYYFYPKWLKLLLRYIYISMSLLHSLWIKPITFALLVPCPTVWATFHHDADKHRNLQKESSKIPWFYSEIHIMNIKWTVNGV